ncbi:hypothetical protein X801_02018 [Opisthorchis viverrini]|uniref:N-acetylgalactosaminide beta-1,3-galactosyltransferase n=1 Tax=Opisthorchis viverrini TaxID=6198 RepID=A0A1S8X5V1_OPIVI|nr:hypothetical protein X801_02018 [Opisthorchis viverrini]
MYVSPLPQSLLAGKSSRMPATQVCRSLCNLWIFLFTSDIHLTCLVTACLTVFKVDAANSKEQQVPAEVLNMTEPEVRGHLWVKMRKILRAIYRMADEYDYFLKADDDTYVFLSNLREFLVNHGNPAKPIMWGYRWLVRSQFYFFSVQSALC